MRINWQYNISKLILIRAIHWFMLIMPVIVLFYQDNGLSMQDIFVLQVVFSLIIVVNEVPSGYFADLVGRRISIICGCLCGAAGFIMYSLAYTFWQFIPVQLLLGLSASFISGADSALLYESLMAQAKEKDYKKYEGLLQFISNASEAVAAVLGGFLAAISLRTPIYCEGLLMLFTIPLAFSLQEPDRSKLDTSDGKFKVLLKIVRFSLWEQKQLKWTIYYSVTHATATFSLVWFIQPYLKQIGLPLIWFGTVWALLNLSIGLIALQAHRIEKLVGRESCLNLLTISALISFLLLSFISSYWGILAILLAYCSRGLRTPLFKDYINQHCSSEQRATVFSIYALLMRLFFCVVGPLLGWITDKHSLQAGFLTSAVIFGGSLIFTQIAMLRTEESTSVRQEV